MNRRQFISLLGGAAAAWPVAARAQRREKRLVGVFTPGTADDPEHKARDAAFLQALGALGWIVGDNLNIEYRWGAGDYERFRSKAADLVARSPDVILAQGSSTVTALQRASDKVPIVFANVTDPVGSGLVTSLARPGGNTTGFTSTEFGFSAKWLELLKELVPRVTRVAVLRSSDVASQIGLFGGLQSAASSLGVELRPIDTRDASNIERTVGTFAGEQNGGLVAALGSGVLLHRELIVALAARYRLPAVYPYRTHVTAGGLASYGPDSPDQFRRAAAYVDRILRGEKPGDLPVQAPTKYEMVINLKTAKALGIDVPATVLARADEVIE